MIIDNHIPFNEGDFLKDIHRKKISAISSQGVNYTPSPGDAVNDYSFLNNHGTPNNHPSPWEFGEYHTNMPI